MDKKVLFCATVDEHIKGCHLPYLKWFKEQGFEVHVATNGIQEIPFCDKKHTISITRSPFKLSNIKAYKELKQIVDRENFKIIHCHTPMGSVITRLASKNSRAKGTKILYTAHGFHFFKGAPVINWLIYYPIEKILAKYTDVLITINKEDYELAISKKFKAKDIRYINGVGVSLDKFIPLTFTEKQKIREKNRYKHDEFIVMYIAEVNKNKNQQMLIKALNQIKDKIPQSRLVLVGPDNSKEEYKVLVNELGLSDKVDFLGFRKDVNELLNICDVYAASSIREGLGLNIIEAMACGVPVCATRNRGHNEVIINKENGYLIDINDYEKLADVLCELHKNKSLREEIGTKGLKSIEKFKLDSALKAMEDIYIEYV